SPENLALALENAFRKGAAAEGRLARLEWIDSAADLERIQICHSPLEIFRRVYDLKRLARRSASKQMDSPVGGNGIDTANFRAQLFLVNNGKLLQIRHRVHRHINAGIEVPVERAIGNRIGNKIPNARDLNLLLRCTVTIIFGQKALPLR